MTNADHAATAERTRSTAAIVRAVARGIIPRKWRARHHRKREQALIAGWHHDWRSLTDTQDTSTKKLSNDCLLIPSDTRTFSGGKGDEAMTVAIITAVRAAGHDGRIFALCETEPASAAARRLGCEPVFVAQDAAYIRAFDRWLETHRPCVTVGIGADSIDGAYGVVGPAGLLAVLDLAAARGSRAIVSGFSLRAGASPALAPFFADLRPEVHLNVRDPVSLERLQRTYGRSGKMVADTAFLLVPTPSPRIAPLREWVDERRAEGRLVLALNVHPMLFAADDHHGREAFLDRLASAIRTVSARLPIAFALVAHDFRPGDADAILLDPLAERLAFLGENLLADYATEFSAGELKAASALFDGAVSARMHFAIASLGSGTPVLGIVYQGKFEGLFALVELPASLLCRPDSSDQEFADALTRFCDSIPMLRNQLADRMEHVRSLAAENFTALRDRDGGVPND